MPLARIYLDLDDVLNEFTLYALESVGCKIKSYGDYPAECGYDIASAARILSGKEMSRREFWGLIHRGVWEFCPQSPECNTIVAVAESLVGAENVYICTRPIRCPGCYAGKFAWVQRNLADGYQDRLILCQQKELLAAPNALLIDDHADNCDAFRVAGGSTMLISRPWNISRRPRYDFLPCDVFNAVDIGRVADQVWSVCHANG